MLGNLNIELLRDCLGEEFGTQFALDGRACFLLFFRLSTFGDAARNLVLDDLFRKKDLNLFEEVGNQVVASL